MFGQNQYLNSAFARALTCQIALSSTLTITMAAIAPPVFAQASTRFTDVESSYWANQYVQSLTQKNVISGFPDGTFRPDAEMTRAQFASVLAGAFLRNDVRDPITFRDVPADHWAAGVISQAYSKGWLSGYPDGTFGLNQPITRLEVLVSLTNGLGLATDAETEALLAAFEDSGAIPPWAEDVVAIAADKQLTVNYPNVRRLNPLKNASRAEIAAITHQALVSAGQANAINSPYVPVIAGRPAVGTPTTETPTQPPVTQTPTEEFAELVASLSSDDTSTRKAAADTLAANGAAAVPDLTLALESDRVQTRAAAAYALNEIGADAAPATPTLLELLKDDDEIVRALATSTLAQVGLDQNVLISVLTAAIQNESGLVKDIAADALVNIGGDAVPALGNLLENEAVSSFAKQSAATLIGDINQADEIGGAAVQTAISILANTLNNGDSDVRRAAAESLGDFGPLADVAIPALSQALLGDNSSLSQTAAESLTRIGQQSVPGLTNALNSDDPLTRLYAADAIWVLTKDSSLILPTLVSGLSDGEVETRELAALGLTYLGRQALPAVPAVRNLLNGDNDQIITVAKLALLLLNNRNDPAATLGLLEPEEQREINSVPVLVEVVSKLWR